MALITFFLIDEPLLSMNGFSLMTPDAVVFVVFSKIILLTV
jgi:hypothetical protein